MSSRDSSNPDASPPESGLAARRLSAAAVEERDMAMATEAGLSRATTITFNDHHQTIHTTRAGDNSEPSSGAPSEWLTPSSSGASRPAFRRGNSSVMQIKKETYTRWSPKKGYRVTTKYFYEEIDGHWTAALIVVCFFVAGVVDSVSFRVFSVFTSLQTGNTVFLALRLSNNPSTQHPLEYVKSIVSLGSYCLGGLVFNVLHRAPSGFSGKAPRPHRWTLFASFFIQSTLLLVSAALAQSGWVSTESAISVLFPSSSPRTQRYKNDYYDLIPIAFLAFESAGQVCLSRVLSINELPTIVVSTLYHDFIADALSWRSLWRSKKSKRDFFNGQKRQVRRILCIVALFVGAIIGGFVYDSPGKLAAALWIAGGVKASVCLAWCLWRKKVVTETITTTAATKPVS